MLRARARGTHFQIPQLTMSNNLTHAAMDSCLISSFLGLISTASPSTPLAPRQMSHISDPANIYCRSECKNTLLLWLFLGNNAKLLADRCQKM